MKYMENGSLYDVIGDDVRDGPKTVSWSSDRVKSNVSSPWEMEAVHRRRVVRGVVFRSGTGKNQERMKKRWVSNRPSVHVLRDPANNWFAAPQAFTRSENLSGPHHITDSQSSGGRLGNWIRLLGDSRRRYGTGWIQMWQINVCRIVHNRVSRRPLLGKAAFAAVLVIGFCVAVDAMS
jgi:hypothetical protein